MGPWYYEVVSFDGDYVNLRRTDIESDELNPVALALLPPEIDVGSKLKCEYFQYESKLFLKEIHKENSNH